MSESRTVNLLTLGCARNSVDSEELAGRLAAAGWDVAGEEHPEAAVTVINTCGFVDAAKQESIDTLLDAVDGAGPVVAVGCLAERYGAELAASLPEVTVLGFDDYADIAARLDDAVAGRTRPAHRPRDRRRLLPVAPAQRPASVSDVGIPGHTGGPRLVRRRLDAGPVAPVKLASGCDRRCSFCAIPSFRGAFVSRPPEDVLADIEWLAARGVREVELVSENTTSYGKDLGDLRMLETLLPQAAAVDGIERVRLSYLQPAELRPSLVEAMVTTAGVAPYFDLSVQHASAAVLRRMRRYGDGARFLELIAQIRAGDAHAGIRSNVIVGFPGETDDDVDQLADFLGRAQLDAIGVFGYSDEDGTEAERFTDKVPAAVISRRVDHVARLADEVAGQRAAERIGQLVDVLVEHVDGDRAEGRAGHQGAADGTTVLPGADGIAVGQVVRARVVAADGVDLVADPADA